MGSPPQAKKMKVSSSSPCSSEGEREEEPKSQRLIRDPLPLPGDSSKARYKRRKLAIFLGYCGHGYQGMQKNPGAKTIEADLEEALYLSFAVPDADRGLPRRYDWARAARTDKGVSAAGQVVSGRFYADPPGLVDRLNSHLSPQIRIFGYKRVTASFNAKKFCDRRRYVYLLPLFAFDPEAHPSREAVEASLGTGNELAKCLQCSERGRKVPGLMGSRRLCENGDVGSGNKCLEVCGFAERSQLGDGGCGESGLDMETNGRSEFGSEKLGVEDSEERSELVKERQDLGDSFAQEKVEVGDMEKSPELKKDREDLGDDFTQAKVEVPELEENPELAKEREDLGDDADEGKENNDGGALNTSEDSQTAGMPLDSVSGREKFEFGEKEKERLNRILKRYVGTHNFHNFTTRTKAEDPSARRYILSFDANSVVNLDGMDFVKCEVVGQSFMLHQIRKMIGLAVAIMRNCTSESILDSALRPDIRINVPTAPEVGLYLEECLFTSYNQKWKDSHEELSMRSYCEEAEDFKMKHILSHIASMEHKEGSVALWLHSLNHRNYPDFRFGEVNSHNNDADFIEESSQVGEGNNHNNAAACVEESSQVDRIVE